MVEIEVETIRIGGSVGIIIPKEITERENIKVKENLIINIKKGKLAGEFFGLLAEHKLPTDEIIKEVKRGWN